VVLYLVDATLSLADIEEELSTLQAHVALDGKHLFLLRNKIDKIQTPEDNTKTVNESCYVTLTISAKQNRGLDELKQCLVQTVRQELPNDDTLVTNARHYEALKHVQESLVNVQDGLTQNLPADLVLIDIREALYYLGQITGQVTTDEILGTIFSRFCVGK
jgi:tRNA modification GTPase